MTVISKKSFIGTTTSALLLFLVAICCQVQDRPVAGVIVITDKEEKCLEKTGKFFESADENLLTARQEFSSAMEMTMTSAEKMKATYPQEQLTSYDAYCSGNGGKIHIIKIDFFDCILLGAATEIELTLKNFANCLADVEECEGFSQEHLLQEAWKELGLACVLEEEETKKDPPFPNGNNNKPDDDIAEKEEEAAAEGADDIDKQEKQAEYIPKEEQDKNGNRKKKGGFLKLILFLSVGSVGYYVFDRHRRGLPIEIPHAISSRLPFRGPSRFARPAQTGFVSDYNLLSVEENSLQLSTNLA